MNLPTGWQEATGTSPLILAFLVLVGASIIVLFLAPFFFKLAKKAKFPQSLNFIKRHPRFSLAAVLIILVALCGAYAFNYFNQPKKPVIKNPQIEKEKVGPRGNFQVNLTRKGDIIILNWDQKVAVSQIQIVALGKDTTDRDNIPVWGISSVNQVSLSEILKTTSPEELQKSEQEAYQEYLRTGKIPKSEIKTITAPYELLAKPDGFYYNQDIKGDQASFKLKRGARYVVELGGTAADQARRAAYVFDY